MPSADPFQGATGSSLRHAIVLAPRKPDWTREQFQRHYEERHAPLFYKYTGRAVGRYLRNHVVRVLGDQDTPFDTISEFGFRPDQEAWMRDRLRSSETQDLEADVHYFLAERGNSFAVDEELIYGLPREESPGAKVAKRLLLMDGTNDLSKLRDIASDIAAQSTAHRVTLTRWHQHPKRPLSAMISIWPGARSIEELASQIPADAGVRWEVDVYQYCSAWA